MAGGENPFLDAISGDDDGMSGDDPFAVGEDEVGAAVRRAVQKGQPINRAILQKAIGKSGNGGGRRGPRSYDQILPMSALPDPVVASGLGVSTGKPQRYFIPERLTVGLAIAQFFSLTQYQIGAEPQFIATGKVPADGFDPRAIGTRLKGQVSGPGTEITIGVKNEDSANPHSFIAMLVGPACNADGSMMQMAAMS